MEEVTLGPSERTSSALMECCAVRLAIRFRPAKGGPLETL
jgi:hypothetical protein